METELITRGEAVYAPLPQFATLAVSGADARAFLHGQLSNDVEHLPADTVKRAGYCSPKGRMIASFLVIPSRDGFLLQVASDIAIPIAKRLSMFVMRSKVKVVDSTETWAQTGVWGRGSDRLLQACELALPNGPMRVAETNGRIVVGLGEDRFLVVGPAGFDLLIGDRIPRVAANWWTLSDVRAGIPLISLATQDQFVPQMANFELIGGVDFKKGCYPGQEIVARSQYLGKIKRRMYRVETDAQDQPAPWEGQDLFGAETQAIGTVVNVALRPEGGYEVLAVMQSASVESGTQLRLGSPQGPRVRLAALPYAI